MSCNCFYLYGTTLKWIKSYLRFRSFYGQLKIFNLLFVSSSMAFLRALFIVLLHSFCIQLLLILLFQLLIFFIIFMRMIPSFTCVCLLLNFFLKLLLLWMLFIRYVPGCLLTFLSKILLKLTFCLLVFLHNCLNSLTHVCLSNLMSVCLSDSFCWIQRYQIWLEVFCLCSYILSCQMLLLSSWKSSAYHTYSWSNQRTQYCYCS